MYNDMYDTFDNAELEYNYPIDFIKRNKRYLLPKRSSSFTWNYGDTVDLVFLLAKRDIEIDEDYLEGKQIVIEFYNFRRELIYERTFVENANEIDLENKVIVVPLSVDVSKNIFKKGSYFCRMFIEDIEDSESREIHTILPEDVYSFYVR